MTIAKRIMFLRGTRIARDEVEGVIQTVVRWKTPEAMRIYARIEAQQYADYVEHMATDPAMVCDGTMPQDLPEIDPKYLIYPFHRAPASSSTSPTTRSGRQAARSSLLYNTDSPQPHIPGKIPTLTFELLTDQHGMRRTCEQRRSWLESGMT